MRRPVIELEALLLRGDLRLRRKIKRTALNRLRHVGRYEQFCAGCPNYSC